MASVPASFLDARGIPSVFVDIAHTYQGDLVVTVRHQSGYTRTLHNGTGGGADNLVGTYPLSDFSGSPAGTWTLTVVDTAAQDVGRLNSWSLSVTR